MLPIAPEMGAPPPAADTDAGPPPGGDLTAPEQILDAMLKLATLYRNVEKDPQDLLGMERVTTLIQQILANQQADQDRLMGGGARAIRRLTG